MCTDVISLLIDFYFIVFIISVFFCLFKDVYWKNDVPIEKIPLYTSSSITIIIFLNSLLFKVVSDFTDFSWLIQTTRVTMLSVLFTGVISLGGTIF